MDKFKLVGMKNNQVVTNSRTIAKVFEKEHRGVLRDLDNLKEGVAQNWADLFCETTYIHEQNKQEYREILMNRDGFTLLAMGFTGKKALEWKLKYINAFNEMEKTLQEREAIPSNLSPQLQLLINIEMKQKEADKKQRQLEIANNENKQEIEDMRNVIQLDTTSWRKDTAQLISKMAISMGGFEHIKDIRNKSYELLDKRMGVALSIRLTNKRRRMAEEGVSKSKRDKLNFVDIIAEDKKLIEGYVAIVKEMAIKYKIA